MPEVQWVLIIKTLLIFYVWLLCILPIFTVIHQRYSSINVKISLKQINPLGWFLELWRVLGLRSRKQPDLKTRFLVQAILVFTIIISSIILASLPLANQYPGSNSPLLLSSNGAFSIYFVLSLLFLQGFIYTAIGFSLELGLLQLTSLEQFTARQSIILVIAFTCFTTILNGESKNLFDLALHQVNNQLGPGIPAWGGISNPIAFIIAIIALTFYTQHWLENEISITTNLRQSIDAHLTGTLLLTFKIAKSLEYLTIYALIITIFLAGPFGFTSTISPFYSLVIFSGKIIILSFGVIFMARILPHIPKHKTMRLMLLVFMPLNFVGYFISLWYQRLLF